MSKHDPFDLDEQSLSQAIDSIMKPLEGWGYRKPTRPVSQPHGVPVSRLQASNTFDQKPTIKNQDLEDQVEQVREMLASAAQLSTLFPEEMRDSQVLFRFKGRVLTMGDLRALTKAHKALELVAMTARSYEARLKTKTDPWFLQEKARKKSPR